MSWSNYHTGLNVLWILFNPCFFFQGNILIRLVKNELRLMKLYFTINRSKCLQGKSDQKIFEEQNVLAVQFNSVGHYDSLIKLYILIKWTKISKKKNGSKSLQRSKYPLRTNWSSENNLILLAKFYPRIKKSEDQHVTLPFNLSHIVIKYIQGLQTVHWEKIFWGMHSKFIIWSISDINHKTISSYQKNHSYDNLKTCR